MSQPNAETDTTRPITRAGRDDPDPFLSAAILKICDPNGVPARTAVIMGAIENARTMMVQCAQTGTKSERIVQIAFEELAKIFRAKDSLDRSMGLRE